MVWVAKTFVNVLLAHLVVWAPEVASGCMPVLFVSAPMLDMSWSKASSSGDVGKFPVAPGFMWP